MVTPPPDPPDVQPKGVRFQMTVRVHLPYVPKPVRHTMEASAADLTSGAAMGWKRFDRGCEVPDTTTPSFANSGL